ncbi:ABC transporter substrate-binding protein, partial [Ochrobactrum sp. SFR4]|uniref:ABC transporter substrate-binding protein n=1 Tax=Ochrobactrum sp. SFR4 TaxID=2717368 RepID=UPI0025704381
TLRLALHSDIGSKNPGVNRDGPSDMVLAHVVEGLVAYGEDLTIKPMLAESWTSNPEATEYVFHLRKGVKFHNGGEMKAEDVVWNFKRYLNAETDFQCTDRYNGTIGAAIEDVSAADDYTVTVKFNAPAPNFLMTLATIQCTPW